MPLIFPSNTLSAGGYTVDNSCSFQDSDSAEMSRAIASTGSNTTWTVSAWVKRVELGQSSPIFGTGDGNADNDARMVFFDAADAIECSYYNGGYTYEVTTNRLFRDLSSWYHICILFDTTESTSTDRIKIYVNGTQETSFATSSYPAEDAAFNFGNTSYTHYVNDMGGRNIRGSHYIAELVYIDGTASAVTNFGEFDSDSPTIWKPIDVSGLSVGTNGVYLDFEDSANLGNDASGGTDFTTSGLDATDQASDSPTNNFATFNPLVTESTGTFSEGNCKNVSSSSTNFGAVSTFGVSSGKWYAEFKPVTATGDKKRSIGVGGDLSRNSGWRSELYLYSFNTQGDSGSSVQTLYDGASDTDTDVSSTYSGYFENDIVGVALDMDNNKVYYSIDGTWQNSADPTAGTNGVSIGTSPPDGVFYFAVMDVSSSDVITYEANFGGCSAFTVSSGNADADGYGNFEYAPPSGTNTFYALCTKNIGAYGG